MRRLYPWAFALASGALWLVIFTRFAPLPKDAYSYRDDAVITLSHAKNLVDYGAIGVDPAAARVEGFSTPLQFWVFAGAYLLSKCGYPSFLDAQVWICTFLLGCAVLPLFRPHYWLGLLLSAAMAFWLTTTLRFFGWHHSGMENAYTHVLFVATLACFCDSLQRRRVTRFALLCAWLATLARVESIVHVAPLIAIWATAYYTMHRSWDAHRGGLIVLGGWLLYQAYRVAYFGSWQPNTALAEGVNVVEAVRMLVLTPGKLPQAMSSLGALRQIAGEHRAYLVLACIPLLALGRRSTERSALVYMLGSLTITALLHPLLFGPARLDPVRTNSHLALVTPLLITTQWLAVPRAWARLGAAAGIAALFALYVKLEPPTDKNFCCPILRADKIADTCLAHAERENISRASLANPDLGRISFRKQLLVFDLGLLGSPALAVLHADHAATADYLLELAQPDFVELHGGWSCEFGYLLEDPRFRERYAVLPSARKLGLSTSCKGGAGIWFRSALAAGSQSPERKLLETLQVEIDPKKIADELRSCRRQFEQTKDRYACAYVARTVYRFIPEIVEAGRLHEISQLFRESPSAQYDMSVLEARAHGTWYRGVVDFVRAK